MGTTSSSEWRLKSDVVREVCRPYGGTRTIAHKVVGQVVYAVKYNDGSANGGTADYWIAVYVLSKHGGEWGYKDMDETSHPFYYDCPLSYLDMVPCPDYDSAREWRRIVRARATKIEVGMRVKLIPGCKLRGEEITEVKISCLRPLIVETKHGQVAMQRKMIESIIAE